MSITRLGSLKKHHVIPDDIIPRGLSPHATGLWLCAYIWAECLTDGTPDEVIEELLDAGVINEAHEIVIAGKKKREKKMSVSGDHKRAIARWGGKQADAVHECRDEIMYLTKEKKAALDKWLVYRKNAKKPLSTDSLRALISRFQNTSLADISAQMTRSVENGYTGIFLDAQKNGKEKEQPTSATVTTPK